MLTIAIPTYNRNLEIIETIKSILPQLQQNCFLIIIDNASDIPVSQTFDDNYIDISKNDHIRLVKNSVNIGAAANLLRCLELCETEWLWILGDDDIPNVDAVSIILQDLEKFQEFTFLNYCSPWHHRNNDSISSGITEFINCFENWAQINFTSLCILNAKFLKPYLRFGFMYAYSWSCINAILFSCLEEKGGKAYFSNKIILHQVSTASDDNKYVPLGPHMCKNILVEILTNNVDKKQLAKKINKKPSLEYIVCVILYLINTTGKKEHYRFIYKTLIKRVYYFNNNIFTTIKLNLYAFILRCPKISYKIVNLFLQKRNFIMQLDNNQFNRS